MDRKAKIADLKRNANICRAERIVVVGDFFGIEDIDYLLSLIDKYRDAMLEIKYLSDGGPEPRVLEINRVAKDISLAQEKPST